MEAGFLRGVSQLLEWAEKPGRGSLANGGGERSLSIWGGGGSSVQKRRNSWLGEKKKKTKKRMKRRNIHSNLRVWAKSN